MQTIASNDIPLIFSAYGIDIGEGYNESIGKARRVVRRSQYWCKKCRSSFTLDHNYHGMMGSYSGFNDSVVYCPNCGHRHENWWRGPHHIYVFSCGNRDETETAPVTANLSLQEGKDTLALLARFQTVSYRDIEGNDDRYAVHYAKRREEFRFNIRKRTAEFIIRDGRGNAPTVRYPIGNPFDGRVFGDSLLLQVESSNHSEEFREGTVNLLKTLRDRARKMWQRIHGHDIGSLFVGYGRQYGRLLFPLVNIAYRLAYADADNLPSFFNASRCVREAAWRDRVMSMEDLEKYGDLESVRKAKDSVSAIIGLFGLPDKPVVRKLLNADIFTAPELARIFEVTDDMGYAQALWHLMQDKTGKGSRPSRFDYCCRKLNTAQMYGFLRALAEHYPVRSIIAHLRRLEWQELEDTKRMLEILLPERRDAFWRERPKLKDLHAALVQATKHQREEGFPLEVPEHIRRRLTMQVDQLRFYLPEHSRELMQIGDELHNCVRTYDENMRVGKSYIVPVTDDNGKLVACLEVRESQLVQAKLKHNKPVSDNRELNGEVIKWAGSAGLEIKTKDIRLVMPEEEPLLLPMPQAAAM